jgi:hypothetical protein
VKGSSYSDFTAAVNDDLKIGTVEETITVTGESPVVDTAEHHSAHCHDA